MLPEILSPVTNAVNNELALNLVYTCLYCLTACLYAKCYNLIGWIMERGPPIHFRTDGPDRLHSTSSQLKPRFLGKLENQLSTKDREK